MENVTTWRKFIGVINAFEDEEEITRRDLALNFKNTPRYTITSYTKLVTEAGFLKRERHGQYKKIKEIPLNITTTALQRYINEDSWKKWFCPVEDNIWRKK